LSKSRKQIQIVAQPRRKNYVYTVVHHYPSHGWKLSGVLATDPVSLAFADTYSFPVNLDSVLDAPSVSTLQAFLQNLNLPNSFIQAGQTYRSVVKSLCQVAQILQRNNGLFQSSIFTTTTAASLQTQSQQIQSSKSLTVSTTPISTAPSGTTLSSTVQSSPTLQNNLSAVAQSFGYVPADPSMTVEQSLVHLGSQFTDRIVLSRGDGFTL